MQTIGVRFIILIQNGNVVGCGGEEEKEGVVEIIGDIAGEATNVVNIGEIILLEYHLITRIIGIELSYKDIDL